MDKLSNDVSFLLVTVDAKEDELLQHFRNMFGSIILDRSLDNSGKLEFIAVKDDDSEEIIDWLRSNFPNVAWDVDRTNKDGDLESLAESASYTAFTNEVYQEEAQAALEESSNDLDENEESDINSDLPEEDDFEGEIPEEESGISDDPDDIEYNEAVAEYANNSAIESGQIYEDSYNQFEAENPDAANYLVNENDNEELDSETGLVEDPESLSSIEGDSIEDEEVEETDIDEIDEVEEDEEVEETEIEDEEFQLDDDAQIELFRNYLDGNTDLVNLNNQDFYEGLTKLNRPTSADPAIRQFMMSYYDMAKLNQSSAVDKNKVFEVIKELDNYHEYEDAQIKDSLALEERLQELDSIFKDWLDDKSNRFPEFYQNLLKSKDEADIELLQTIQGIINASNERVNYYSDILADEVDTKDPDILKRISFNEILNNSYQNAEGLFIAANRNAVDDAINQTLNEAQLVMDEKLMEKEEENKKLLNELESLRYLAEDNNESSSEVADDLLGEEDEFKKKLNDLQNDEELQQEIEATMNDEDFDDEDVEGDTFSLDDDEYEDEEEDGFFSSIMLWPLWKKIVAGALVIGLLGGVGCTANKIIKNNKRNEASQTETVDEEGMDSSYTNKRFMEFVKSNFAVGDEIALTVDGEQKTYTISDYAKDGEVGLIAKSDDGKTIELDQSVLRQYIEANETLKAKETTFNTKYDAENATDKNDEEPVEPVEDRKPIQNEGVDVDFGDGAKKEDKTEEPENQNEDSIKRDDMDIKIEKIGQKVLNKLGITKLASAN